jgi:hypothetical protein
MEVGDLFFEALDSILKLFHVSVAISEDGTVRKVLTHNGHGWD